MHGSQMEPSLMLLDQVALLAGYRRPKLMLNAHHEQPEESSGLPLSRVLCTPGVHGLALPASHAATSSLGA